MEVDEELAELFVDALISLLGPPRRPHFMRGVHFHACPRADCRHVWQHDRRLIPEGGYTEAHTCPKCHEAEAYTAYETQAIAEEKAGK